MCRCVHSKQSHLPASILGAHTCEEATHFKHVADTRHNHFTTLSLSRAHRAVAQGTNRKVVCRSHGISHGTLNVQPRCARQPLCAQNHVVLRVDSHGVSSQHTDQSLTSSSALPTHSFLSPCDMGSRDRGPSTVMCTTCAYTRILMLSRHGEGLWTAAAMGFSATRVGIFFSTRASQLNLLIDDHNPLDCARPLLCELSPTNGSPHHQQHLCRAHARDRHALRAHVMPGLAPQRRLSHMERG
jgi:hypothetical protein